MREYFVTTNMPVCVCLPTLTVYVRTAFFNPAAVLPPEDAGEPIGRETWVNGRAVLTTFQVSTRPVSGAPIGFRDVVDLGGKLVAATARDQTAGIVLTDVHYSGARHEGDHLLLNRGGKTKDKAVEVGTAFVPLVGLAKGEWILKIVPPKEETTEPTDPAGPETKIPAKRKGLTFTYRPLFVRLRLDDDLHLVNAATCIVDQHGLVHDDAADRSGHDHLQHCNGQSHRREGGVRTQSHSA